MTRLSSPDLRAFPPLEHRQKAMLDLVPRADGGPGLLPLLGREIAWAWSEQLVPLIGDVAPSLLSGPFVAKLQAGFGLYYGLATSALFFSSRRPTSVRTASALARALSLKDPTLLRAAYFSFPALYRGLHRRRMQRAAWMSAFILAVDHGVDEGMADVPLAERPAAMANALNASSPQPRQPSLRLARALVDRCRATVTDAADARELQTLMERMTAWANNETSSLVGATDETGIEHRRYGIRLSIDLLAWAIRPHALTAERDWMVSVAEFGQIVDDWLDLEKDAGEGRVTPAHVGLWDPTTAAQAIVEMETRLMAMADASGEPAQGPWRRMMQRTLKGQSRIIVKVLIANP